MKKCFLCFLTVCLLFLCACGIKTTDEDDKLQVSNADSEYVYDFQEINSFDIDNAGLVYAYQLNEGSIVVFDTEGKEQQRIEVGEGNFSCLCVGKGFIYAACQKADNSAGISLVSFSLSDGKMNVLYENPLASSIKKIELMNQKLYFQENQVIDDYAEAQELSDYEAGYLYCGERLMCFSLNEKKAVEIPIDGFKGFCSKNSETMYFYAYDVVERDFYFGEYNTKKSRVEKERYFVGRSLSELGTFVYDKQYKKLLLIDTYNKEMLSVNPEAAKEQTVFLMTEAAFDTEIKCNNGNTYFLCNGMLHCIKNSDYMRDYSPLKIYERAINVSIPGGTGFSYEKETIMLDQLTTELLAGNSDYDIMILTSEDPLAKQIQRIGAFAPLNEVEGINEYLDESFDYIKDSAITDGNIWMLPFDVSCDVLVFNPELCRNYGFDLEKDSSFQNLSKAEKKLCNSLETNPVSYYYKVAWDRYRLIDQYIADYGIVDGHARFDTELFRSYSEMFKENFEWFSEYKRNFGITNYEWLDPLSFEDSPSFGATAEEIEVFFLRYFKNFAMGAIGKGDLFRKYSGVFDEDGNLVGGEYGFTSYDFFEIKPMPALDEYNPGKSLATVYFMVVNPNSSKKKEAFEFLSAIVDKLRKEESLVRTKELRGEYTLFEEKINHIYADARVCFKLPDDVFETEYQKYLNGDKTLDEVIPELERKLNAYLNE